MSQPTFLSFGPIPHRQDTINTLLKRISGGVDNITSGGGGGSGLVGVVDPEGVVTADVGTPYSNTMLKTFWYKESGSGNTGWTQYV